MRQLFAEPFLQFLVLGAALFGAHQAFGEGSGDAAERTVVVDEAFVRAIVDSWKAKRLRPPTASELRSEIGNRVRQEVLYQEGLLRGLDQDDLIIKRRVAQKMDFIAAELASMEQVTEQQLRDFHRDHPERFLRPARVSFGQVVFLTEKRGDEARAAAQSLLATLQADRVSFEEAQQQADVSLLPLACRKWTSQRWHGPTALTLRVA